MVLGVIRDLLWSFPVVSLLIISGGYFVYKTKFRILCPVCLIKDTLGKSIKSSENKMKLLASVSTALGGTVGVGSIMGVSLALNVGGAGSIFWMWVSGLCGMGLKYAEVFIAVKHRKRLGDGSFAGGAPYALTEIGHSGLGKMFAFLTVFASFGVGNMTQISALTDCVSEIGISPLVCGAICAGFLAFAVFGGQNRIGKINLFSVPAASFIYIFIMGYILCLRFQSIPGVFLRILKEAFGLRSAVGGISGVIFAAGIREGFARGIFSSEAGVGSSPLAHASSGEGDPCKQGEWGAFEVLVDTFFVSTLTAFALLSTGNHKVSGLFVSLLGTAGLWLFIGLTVVFAFSSILSWCFYADVCLTFLHIPYGKAVYRGLCVAVVLLGSFLPASIFWVTADILNALMMFPNLFLLFLTRKEITFRTTKEKQYVAQR